ncbi:hypothetical protein CBF33_07525 [Vagococcus lutrae]|nr:hypothetical protein CBF33_07525 [Vagococcus lutrae]
MSGRYQMTSWKKQWLIKKLTMLVLLLLGTSFLTLLLIDLSPIDPVDSYIRGKMLVVSHEQAALISERFNANQHFIMKYLLWLKMILSGDLGTSILYQIPVSQLIFERFQASFLLLFGSWFLSGVVGYIVGFLAGITEKSLFDKFFSVLSYITLSTPSFWIGMILIMIFSVSLGWFPTSLASPAQSIDGSVSLGDRLHHVALPLLTLTIVSSSNIMLFTRQKVIAEKKKDYYQFSTVNTKETLSNKIKQLLPNTILPAIVLQFASFGEVFGGSMLVEQVFSYPGLGKLTVDAGVGGDIPLVLGIVLFMTVTIFVGNQLADYIRLKLDPRTVK